MNREIIIAAICAALTIGVAWAVSHPARVWGSAITVVAFLIVAVVSYLRSSENDGESTRLRRFKTRATEKKD